MSAPKVFHLIVNPAAGHGFAPTFVTEHVAPLLTRLSHPYELHTTSAPLDAGAIGARIAAAAAGWPVKVIVAGGDGTAHELIEGLYQSGLELGEWSIAVLPLGTANALYHSLFPSSRPAPTFPIDTSFIAPDALPSLYSLLSALSGTTPRPLPITCTRLISAAGQSAPPIFSHIVLSTSLHASILADSEALRPTHPGTERFKLAAQANLGVFYRADAVLLPVAGASVTQYDPHSDMFVAPFTSTATDGRVELAGPFTYLLSSTLVPRLEPTFVIAPTLQTHPPTSPSMDVVVLRPLRDPRVRATLGVDVAESRQTDPQAAGAVWAERAVEVLGQAYSEGAHVALTYPVSPGGAGAKPWAAQAGGDGEVVVEVYRCGGFEWTPVSEPAGDKARTVCADGSLHTLEPGGRAEVVVGSGSAARFAVWN
ncbi:hypothetical protein Q5752_004164 [Cryptotrichosporon argae]